MIQSLLIKLAMLALTMGVVLWIGWQAQQPVLTEAHSDTAPGSADSSPASTSGPAQVQASTATPAGVPTKPVATVSKKGATDVADKSSTSRLLDLNRASIEDIESLPGIGPVLAQRVIDYRKTTGGFQSVDQLREVKGIGAKKLERMRPFVMVGTAAGKSKADKQAL
jgi:competence protein ComEA